MLSPRISQSLTILAMSLEELETHLVSEMKESPLLNRGDKGLDLKAKFQVEEEIVELAISKNGQGQFVVELIDYFDGLAFEEHGLKQFEANYDLTEPELEKFVQAKINNARWLVESIHQRQLTIRKVGEIVVNSQTDFLNGELDKPKLLDAQVIAEELGIAKATLGRALNEKWIKTGRGKIALRDFFTEQPVFNKNGPDYAIMETLKRLVEQEDKSKPLSDEAIAKALKSRGENVARRAVTKCRIALGIPSSLQRQR